MLLDFIFPNRCLDCNLIISSNEVVCAACLDQIDFTHYNFNTNNPLKEKCSTLFPIEKAFALMKFSQENSSQKILHQLKYGSRKKIGKILAEWTLEKCDITNNKPDIIATIPLHPKKQKQRGYNQLHLFADTLAKTWEIPVDHEILKRNTFGKAQAQRNKSDRSKTINQFSLTKDIQNQHILIIDDVFTTGNTMSLAAWEFLQHQDNKISVLVMAID